MSNSANDAVPHDAVLHDVASPDVASPDVASPDPVIEHSAPTAGQAQVWKTQLTADLATAKATGASRIGRIRNIVKQAAVETVNEVKVGGVELKAIAQDSFTTVVDNFSDTPASTQAAPKTQIKAFLLGMLKALKTKLTGKAQQQWSTVDDKLNQRYGDRYNTVRDRVSQNVKTYVENIPGWDDARRATTGQTPLEQQQMQLEGAVGDLGTQVAQREMNLRQQLKDFLTTKS